MHTTFYVRGRFHPGYSLLGQWLRRRTGDARRAEALLILILAGLALLLLLVYYLASLFLPAGGLTTPLARMAWPAGLGAAAVLFLTCVLGFAPSVRVTCTPARLHLWQGQRTCTIPREAIQAVSPLSPRLFHRHYRRYAATRAFVVRPADELLLIRTAQGPIVLGLPPADQATLLAHLGQTHHLSPYSMAGAGVPGPG